MIKRPTRRALLTFVLLLSLITLGPAVRAQDEPPPPMPPVTKEGADDIETIRVESDLVNLNVSVFSRALQLVPGNLQQQDFTVLENGVPEEIAFFAAASTPFDLVLLLDLSGSISDKLKLVKKSAIRFVEAARPSDRIGILTFTDVPSVVSPLTGDRAQLVERIKRIEKPMGGTNFWDALGHVLKLGQPRAAEGLRRRAVIVMTDGVDNALPDVAGPGSQTTFEELLDLVRDSDAVVLPIYLDTEREEAVRRHRVPQSVYPIARSQLAQLAAESGSILYQARALEDLNGVYEQVIRDLGTVYSIGYRPTNRRRDGAWRVVSVRLVNHPSFAARTRRGYFAR
ncbi:MAG TPA: VWA domain-containing protein [Pyrinomonadaceae bacterium]|jgi:VWFA-related protein